MGRAGLSVVTRKDEKYISFWLMLVGQSLSRHNFLSIHLSVFAIFGDYKNDSH
jgi:hypothetical protein